MRLVMDIDSYESTTHLYPFGFLRSSFAPMPEMADHIQTLDIPSFKARNLPAYLGVL